VAFVRGVCAWRLCVAFVRVAFVLIDGRGKLVVGGFLSTAVIVAGEGSLG
jgi:hypothetical protein